MAKLARILLLSVLVLSGCDFFNTENGIADLKDLTMTGAELEPDFYPSTLKYTATVNDETNETVVTATTWHPGAKLKINGTETKSGIPSAPIPLSYGTNAIAIDVTSEDGDSNSAYTITVTRPEPTTYSIGGSISGHSGAVTLQNNGADDLVVNDDDTFTFATELDDGASYEVTVSGHPDGQECSVSNGVGTVDAADVTNIAVTCVALTHNVGGSVAGLAGTLVLQNNGGDDLSLTENGEFTFATPIAEGADYNVTIGTQPDGQVCSIEGGAGTMGNVDVTNVSVTCVVLTYTVGGSVGGLTGTLLLQNNGGDGLTITENGPFTFATALPSGSAYVVTVGTQPAGQACGVENGAGTIAGGNVSNVSVTCVVMMHTVGGSVSGLNGTLVLQNNGGDDLTLSGNGPFTFATSIASGDTYNVTVGTQPDGQVCSVSSGVGTVGDTDITSIGVSCVDSGGGSSSGFVWANPLPQGNNINDLIWNGNMWVAVGAYGTILTSTNGSTWTTQDSGTREALGGIAWDGSKFIVAGGGATILSSPDGVNWTSVNLGVISQYSDVIWNGNQFVVVGNGLNSQVATSPDGVTWTVRNVATSYVSLVDIAWNGNVFAAVASGSGIYNYVYTSSNGITWTRNYLGPNNSGESITTDGNQFVVAADRYVFTSPDGATWTNRLTSNELPYGVSASLWNGDQFVLVGSRILLTSPDGITWAQDPNLRVGSVLAFATDGAQYLVSGRAGNLANSADLATWTIQTTGYASHLYSVVFEESVPRFVAVGHNTLLTSDNGTVWTLRDQGTPNYPNSASLNDVSWGADKFVAVGSQGRSFTSDTGETWTPHASGATTPLYSIVWGDSQFIAVGYDNRIISSPDGITWTDETSSAPDGTWLETVAWDGTQFIAGGRLTGGNSIVMTSPDGINWTNTAFDAAQWDTPQDIVWNGSQLLLITSRSIFTSPDAVTWTQQTNGVPDNEMFNAGFWSGNEFIILASSGLILISADNGVSWSTEYAPTGQLNGVARSGGLFVIVGNQGAILTISPD